MESMRSRRGKETGEIGKQVRRQARKAHQKEEAGKKEVEEGLPEEMHSSSETKMRKVQNNQHRLVFVFLGAR